MLKDPVGLKRRKPQRLRGTPANRFVNLLAFGTVSLFTSLCLWFTYSEAEWVKRSKAHLHEKVKRTDEQILRKKIYEDPLLTDVVVLMKSRIAAKAVGENLDDLPIREFVEERTAPGRIFDLPDNN